MNCDLTLENHLCNVLFVSTILVAYLFKSNRLILKVMWIGLNISYEIVHSVENKAPYRLKETPEKMADTQHTRKNYNTAYFLLFCTIWVGYKSSCHFFN